MSHLKYDVVVIGAGIIGLSAAYELAKQNIKVALLDSKRLGDNCSVGNTGLVLNIEDPKPNLNYYINKDSLECWKTLSKELNTNLEYEPIDCMQMIKTEEEMLEAQEKMKMSLDTEFKLSMLSPKDIQEMEPLVDSNSMLGGLVSTQGTVNPFNLLYGYFKAARSYGMQWFPESKVIGIEHGGNHVLLHTKSNTFKTAKVIIAAGAWTRETVSLLGVDLPQHYVHGEVLVTEAIPKIMTKCLFGWSPERIYLETEVSEIAAASNWYGSNQSLDAMELVITQVPNGNILIGQRSFAKPYFYDEVNHESFYALGIRAVEHMPVLKDVNIIRSWISPVPFTPDHEPFVGPIDKEGRIILSSGYLSTLLFAPVLAKQVTKMALGNELDYDLSTYSPGRFQAAGIKEG